MNYVPGKGPRYPRIVILGESPSYEDIKSQTPFTGGEGNFLKALLREAQINIDECWLTYVVKTFVTPAHKESKIPFATRATKDGVNLETSVNELLTELSQLKPNVIITLGKTALWALTGKTDLAAYRGSILQGCGFKLVPTYKPGDILYNSGEVNGYWNRAVVKLDLIRAREESFSKEYKVPARNLQIVKSSAQMIDFFRRNQGALAVDTEKRNNHTFCVGLGTRDEAITLALFDEKRIPKADLIQCWNIVSDVLNTRPVIGQNFGYDRKELRPYGLNVKNFIADTMLKAFCVNPELPKSQEFLASIYTREPHYKNDEMYQSTDDALLLGCSRDCAVSFEINQGLDKDLQEMGLTEYYERFIHQLHNLYHYNDEFSAIEQFGFRVDEATRTKLIHKYVEWTEKIKHKLYVLTDQYVNTGSPQQVAKLLYEDFGIPERKGTGEEVLTALLGNTVKNPVHKEVISLILEDRRVKKTLNSYLYSPPDFDGRMRTSYFLCLKTGRSATEQLDPPAREKLEYRDEDKKLKRTAIGMSFQVITKHGDIGSDIGTMLVADEGHILIGIDSAQAEARVIFLLAEDYEALELIDKIDYHALTTTWFFGGEIEQYDKKVLGYESPERFCGKTLRHAGHLGAGKKRAAIEVNTQARKAKIDYSISEYQAGKALEIFHEKQPKIRGVFQAGVIDQLQKTRRLVSPVPYGVDAKVGGTRIFFERWGDDLFREAFSYIPQRTVSENTKGAALRSMKRAPYMRVLVEAHDGLLVQVPENLLHESVHILREEMQRPIDFSTCSLKRGTLVIPAEVEVGYNFKELKKYKNETNNPNT